MPVTTTHTDYNNMLPKWSLVRDIVNNDAKKYIRTVDKDDPDRSKQYKCDAILTNFTRLTKIGLTGLVFRKPPTIRLAPGIEYLETDATGHEFGLEQFCQQIIGEVLVTGRYGILIDYPQYEGDGKAKFKPYIAENIINWRYEEYDSKYVLTLLVLKEEVCVEGIDMFDFSKEDQYRVLYLDESRNYHQSVYNKEGDRISDYLITDFNGNTLDFIPFAFIGSENNDSTMDSIPLYDMAVVNLGHYRNSADLEEAIFICGQPFLHINVGENSNKTEFDLAYPDGVCFGARSGLVTQGGSLELLQANPNQMVSVEMKRKEEQAAAIGARLIAPPGGRETAEAARIRYGAQNSSLYVITQNTSIAIEWAAWVASLFMLETPVESEFKLNDQFYEESVDPNLISQQILLLDRGVIQADEIRDSLKRSGVLSDESESDIDPNLIINPLAMTDTVDDTEE